MNGAPGIHLDYRFFTKRKMTLMATTEPVLVNGIVGIITAILTPLLVKYGIDADGSAKILGFVPGAVTAIVSVVTLFLARSKVTPVAK